ncbi:D-TA family PLP-dependent enzyme [Reichenbachiella sp.]
MMSEIEWYKVKQEDGVVTPALLVYPDRIGQNIRKMIELSRDVDKLRPHIKTHKSADIIKLQLAHGTTKFKCATLPEAELLATSGAKDVLLAMQPVGPNVPRFFELMVKFPVCNFSTLVDNEKTAVEISRLAQQKGLTASLWLDINNGMDRTGISPGPEAICIYEFIANDPFLNVKGLHVYDGHIHHKDLELRKNACNDDFNSVESLRSAIEKKQLPFPMVVAGGTPTFIIHKDRKDVQLSPGTPLLWDAGYAHSFPDLSFVLAAVVATRIVSQPSSDLLCLDLGYKSVASEMELPRVKFLGGHDFEIVGHNEEHMVVRTHEAHAYEIGQLLYAVPIHICPTVVKYDEMLVIEKNELTATWPVGTRSH